MDTTTLHITIDRETKLRAQKLAKELGLDISTVVRAGLKQFVRTESFSVEKPSYRMTPYLEEIIRSAKETPNDVSGPFTNAEDVIAHLRSIK